MLVACEFSGIVRDAFIERGHQAISCDLLPTERPGPHIQGDVLSLLQEPWDLVIAFPPCNYLSHINRWFKNDEKLGFEAKYREAIDFFLACRYANAPRICVENPNQMPQARIALGKPDDWVEPYQFGHVERKRTGLWLTGLPPLMRTLINPSPQQFLRIRGKPFPDRPNIANGVADNGHDRSRFWSGIAAAMAQQWGGFDTNGHNAEAAPELLKGLRRIRGIARAAIAKARELDTNGRNA